MPSVSVPALSVLLPAPITYRIQAWRKLLTFLEPVPTEWIAKAQGKARHSGGDSLECLPCNEYSVLVNSWKKAMRWTDGLDQALAVMLAAVASTKSVGDQLWVKIIGPAACLDGDTPIYDPVDRSLLTVRDRWASEKKFWVYTRRANGAIGVAQALPPERFPRASMYKLVLRSGRIALVTGGHRIWNGKAYIALQSVSDELRRSGVYHLPTISGNALLAPLPSAQRWKSTALDSLRYCYYGLCPYDARLLSGRETVRVGLLLRDDAQGHIQGTYGVPRGLECKHTQQGLQTFPPSNYHSASPVLLTQSGTAFQFREISVGFGKLNYWSGTNGHTRIEIAQTSRFLPTGRFPPGSSNTVELLQPPLARQQQLKKLHGTFSGTQLRSGFEGSSSPMPSSWMVSEDVSLPAGKALQLGVEPAVEEPGQFAGFSLFQQMGGPLGKVRPRGLSGLGLQDAYWTSVTKGDRDLDRFILPETDEISYIEYVGEREYFDFHVPETNNYWACGMFHHNCGKSTLCEAISVCTEYVTAKSTIRGFHSGYRLDGGGEQDHSLIPLIRGKTLVTKDGDTLLQSPNLSQILSEARDLYDSTARTHYRNAVGKDYSGIRMTWILCGTSSLRAIDSSELGQRFLDCVIMEGIDDSLEEEVLWRVVNRAARNLAVEANGRPESQYEPELSYAMQLTGGYVQWLRENASEVLSTIDCPVWAKRLCARLGKFVAYMRARPSLRQEETVEREFAPRLASQLVRLAGCLALVLNRPMIDEVVMGRVQRVAKDTSRGQTLAILARLHSAGEGGLDPRTIAMYTGRTEEKTRSLLRFLKQIEAIEFFTPEVKGVRGVPRWRMTPRMQRLYLDVASVAEFIQEQAVEVL